MALTNKQLQHLFAQDNADTLTHRKNGNSTLCQRGNTLVSYETPIAKWHEDQLGWRVLLVTSDGYTITTKTKHLSGLAAAVYPSPLFSVKYIGAEGGEAPHQPDNWHEANLQELVDGYREQVARLSRKRNEPCEVDLQFLQRGANQATAYAVAFGLPVPEIDAQADFDRGLEAWRAKQTPEAQARRLKAAAQRAEAERIRQENEAILAREQIAQWKAGQRQSLGSGTYRLPIQLRLKDSETVQTSRGAEVPYLDALAVFRMARICHARGTTYDQQLSVGGFVLNGIDAQGNATIGCHHLQYDVMEDFAREIGVLARNSDETLL